jgi:pimeloyl-ACP methyl ester carboxylesterase
MSTYVLIHGAWHGGWCWDRVVPLLEQHGHSVIAPDLPGHGDDKTPLHQVTLQAYADKVCEVVNAQAEPVILVGHSMGGMVITRAAEQCVSKISKLVYLAAILLGNEAPVPEDPEALIGPSMILSADQNFFTVKEDMIKPAFYGDCSNADIAWATSKLTPQPSNPMGQSATTVTTEENYGRIPRVYIECLKDRAITPAAQKTMYTNMPCEQVISMTTDHSPFLSDPEGLAEHLHRLRS